MLWFLAAVVGQSRIRGGNAGQLSVVEVPIDQGALSIAADAGELSVSADPASVLAEAEDPATS